MLTIDALNQITATHAAAAGRPLGTFVPAVLVPENYELQNIERLQELRSRFRGAMTTTSMPDFCAHVERRADELDGEPTPSGFIDPDAMCCKVFFNLGDAASPGHADDTAALSLKPTAAYAALHQIAGKALSQAQLAEWMEDWAAYLKVVGTEGEDITVGVAVQKIRTIKIKATSERESSENNFSATRSAMDQIEASHAEQQPADLLFHIHPYEGLQAQTFILRLSIITGEKPTLKPRWVQQEAQQEAIAQEFKQVLKQLIGGFANLTLGTFNPGN